MGAAFSIQIRGDRAFEQELGALADRMGNLRPLMEIFGIYLESSVLERFEREEAPDGSKWTPSIRAKETGGKTLTDRALLKQSNSYQAGDDYVEVGTNLKKAGPLHEGAVIRAKDGGNLKFKLPGGLGFRSMKEVILPARPWLGFSDEDEIELPMLAEDWVRGIAPGLSA